MFLNLFYMFFFIMVMMIFMFLKFCLMKIYLIIEINMVMLKLLEFKIYFLLDWMSLIFLAIVLMISSCTFYFSKFYMKDEFNHKKKLFLILTSLFVLSMILMILSLNLFFILLGWDGLGLISYALVIYYQNEISSYSGMITIMTNRLGDICIILSMFMIFNFFSLDLILINEMKKNYIFMFLLILGAFTKSAQFPFSAWLPLAMAAPTPISALVHSSTLVTAGVYLIIRLHMMLKMNNSNMNMNFLFLTLLTMFFSGICALSEMDFKKIIALSTLSQLGLMMIILFSGFEILSFFHLLTHAIFKASLFLCSGVFIYEFSHNQDVRCYPMMLNLNSIISSIFILASLSLGGFPFLSGFYSKDLILELFYMMNLNLMLLFIVVISIFLTCLYSLRLIYLGLMMKMKINKMIYLQNWDNIYNSIIFLSFFIMISGAILNWLFYDIFSVTTILNFSMKFLNYFLIIMSFCMFALINMNFNKIFMYFFSNMWYLTNIQGKLVNIIMKNSNFFFKEMDVNWLEYSFYKFQIMQFNLFFTIMNFFKFIFFKNTLILIIFFIMFLMI